MENLTVACATDEGDQLINRHFGEAGRYDIYELQRESVKFMRSIENTVPEERDHADPQKARNIGGLLKPAGVQVLVSGQFGQNIKRVRKSFVPVIVRSLEINTALEMLQQHYEEIVREYERGEERKHIVLRKPESSNKKSMEEKE